MNLMAMAVLLARGHGHGGASGAPRRPLPRQVDAEYDDGGHYRAHDKPLAALSPLREGGRLLLALCPEEAVDVPAAAGDQPAGGDDRGRHGHPAGVAPAGADPAGAVHLQEGAAVVEHRAPAEVPSRPHRGMVPRADAELPAGEAGRLLGGDLAVGGGGAAAAAAPPIALDEDRVAHVQRLLLVAGLRLQRLPELELEGVPPAGAGDPAGADELAPDAEQGGRRLWDGVLAVAGLLCSAASKRAAEEEDSADSPHGGRLQTDLNISATPEPNG
mmetsp:Transcript_15227/g.41614  ORF Transcript_15227/g.41614 Transcript_15227/m.41614 type:complete len:273 (-) Transcript_15227:34-852(-)